MTASNASRINRTELLWHHFKKKAAQEPTITDRNAIALEHKNIVRKIAHSIALRCRVEYEDLEQIGMIGILKAVEKFDPTKGVAFSSFATPYIKGEILHFLRDSGSNVKIPRRAREGAAKANKIERQWVLAGKEPPTEQELAALIGCTVEKLRSVREAVAHQHACEFSEDYDQIPEPETFAIGAELNQGLETTWQQLRRRLSELPNSERVIVTDTFCRNVSARHLGLRYNMTQDALRGKLERVLIRIAQ